MVINSSNKVDANCLSPVQCVLKSGDRDQGRAAVRAGGSCHLQNSEVAFTPMLQGRFYTVEILATEFKQSIERSTFSKVSDMKGSLGSQIR